jgi:hypothetical protein
MAGSKDGGDNRGKQNHCRQAVIWHRLHWRVAHRMLDGEEAGADELATELDEPRGWVAYHLRVLVKCRVLKVVPKCNPAPPRYRWGREAQWARDMLTDDDEKAA